MDLIDATRPPQDVAGRLRRLPAADALARLRADPDLLTTMKAEHVRLSGKRGTRPLVDCCAISKMHHAFLTQILPQVEVHE